MNILIADDHDIFRQSLALLLENRTAHRVVGHVATFTDLIERAPELKPDCILLDYHIPGGDPLKTSDVLKRAINGLKIIMLTGAQSGAVLKQLAQHLFEGVLHKRDDADVILHAIEQVATGERYISRSVLDLISEVDVELTQRETQILTLYMQGMALSRIAEVLNISTRTVEKHKENMMKKLDVTTSVQLIEAGHKLLIDE